SAARAEGGGEDDETGGVEAKVSERARPPRGGDRRARAFDRRARAAPRRRLVGYRHPCRPSQRTGGATDAPQPLGAALRPGASLGRRRTALEDRLDPRQQLVLPALARTAREGSEQTRQQSIAECRTPSLDTACES